MTDQDRDTDATAAGLYPIRAASGITGVNPVTLRAWERRYGLVKPQRTPKGHRLYTEDDIELVRRILRLVDRGVAISRVKSLLGRPGGQTAEAIPPDTAGDDWGGYHRRMCTAAARLDVGGIESAHNETLALYPEEPVTRRLLQPVLRSLGDGRFEDPEAEAHWHFLRSCLRHKLGARLHHAEVQAQGPRVLVAGLPGEAEDIEMLMLSVLVCGAGYRTVSLGPNVPPDAVVSAVRRAGARAALLFGEASPAPALLHTVLPSLVRRVAVPVLVGGRICDAHDAGLERAGAVPLPREPGPAVRIVASRVPR